MPLFAPATSFLTRTRSATATAKPSTDSAPLAVAVMRFPTRVFDGSGPAVAKRTGSLYVSESESHCEATWMSTSDATGSVPHTRFPAGQREPSRSGSNCTTHVTYDGWLTQT